MRCFKVRCDRLRRQSVSSCSSLSLTVPLAPATIQPHHHHHHACLASPHCLAGVARPRPASVLPRTLTWQRCFIHSPTPTPSQQQSLSSHVVDETDTGLLDRGFADAINAAAAVVACSQAHRDAALTEAPWAIRNTPVVLALLEAVIAQGEAAQRERRDSRRGVYSRRPQGQPDLTSDPATQTLEEVSSSSATFYSHLLFSPTGVRYFPAPQLFRHLMRLAASYPVGHVCKDEIACGYTWGDFEAVLRLMDSYVISDDGVRKWDAPVTATSLGEADDGDAEAEPGSCEEPAWQGALRTTIQKRFWLLCPSLPDSVLDLSGARQSTGHAAEAEARAEGDALVLPVDARRVYLARRQRQPGTPNADDDVERAVLESAPPPFILGEPLAWRSPSTCPAPDAHNQFNGWGSFQSIPRAEDVRAILPYIPVNWGNLGTVAIPSEVRTRHMRSGSPLLWFRRQPLYFEVRDMNGTTEIRRGVALHSEAHGLTQEAALGYVQMQMVDRSANHLVPLLPDGSVLPSLLPHPDMDETAATSTMTTTPECASTNTALTTPLRGSLRGLGPAERATLKFFARVCPPYFTTLSLLVQRATKKTINEAVLLRLAEQQPTQFEILRCAHSDIPLVRQRGSGADPSRWRAAFVADLESRPEDVSGILAVMCHLCVNWDRPEYVYVRLATHEQTQVRGYDGMVALLRRHPSIFRVGHHYVSRVDSSDPSSQQESEPAPGAAFTRTFLSDQNPYLTPRELAKVFFYVAPDNEPFTPTFLVERASPAMQVALPPRVVSLLQLFPDLFACAESAPGVFSVHKMRPRTSRDTARLAVTPTREGRSGETDTSRPTAETHIEAEEEEIEDHSWMRDTVAEEGTLLSRAPSVGDGTRPVATGAAAGLTRLGVVEAVRLLVPPAGVDSAQLLLWAPLPVQRAASQYFGGVVKLAEAEKSVFRVEEAPDASKRIFLREPPTP